MLYNPHTRVPSLESMAAWLETKDPNEEYSWIDSHKCACAQYAKARGVFDQWRGHGWYSSDRPVWHDLNMMAQHCETFGKLLERVREAMNAAIC